MTAALPVRPLDLALFDRGDGGVPLGRAHGTDLDRIGWLLQGTALVAHLEQVGWTLRDDGPTIWSKARIDAHGSLRIDPLACCRGRPVAFAQLLATELLTELFRSTGDIAGRGTGRRIARTLQAQWGQAFVAESADAVVARVLDLAPFLWREAFANARKSLAGEHKGADGSRVWLVGPGGARRRFLRLANDRDHLEALLADGEQARDLWLGVGSAQPAEAPRDLARRGRWRRAAALVRERGPIRGAAALEVVGWLRYAGHALEALDVLGRRQTIPALLLRLACQSDLGDDQAAWKTFHRLKDAELTPSQMVELADQAIRLLAKRRRFDEVEAWRLRLTTLATAPATSPDLAAASRLIAAEASWDLGQLDDMADQLEAARACLDAARDDLAEGTVSTLMARWHQSQALCLHGQDGCVAHAEQAVRRGRRRAPRARAGRLWNDLAVARASVDDLPGAERAARQAVRLFLGCQGSTSRTLPIYNLAEARVRRGRLSGVETAIHRSLTANRKAGNLRAVHHDLRLAGRLELARGRFRAALSRIADARHLGLEEYDRDLDILEARAQGLLGRRGRAQAALANIDSVAAGTLEPEERPGLWALAGCSTDAECAARGTPWEPLWTALVHDREPELEAWSPLNHLEAYRAARVVLDVEIFRPGTVSPTWIRRAAASFRQVDAHDLVNLLERRSKGPWRALAAYLDSDRDTHNDLGLLLRETGHDDVRWTWQPTSGSPRLLAGGPGGEACLESDLESGSLRLEADAIDPVLEALFHVVRRDLVDDSSSLSLAGELEAAELATTPPGPSVVDAAGDGIIGRSPALLAALDRLDRLAVGRMPILVTGESGTGKESAARRIHRRSGRSGRWVPVNCAEFTESLIQSELFGHVRGAFTGAEADRAGAFESARGGTVFLDEIGDLPLASQGMLLRVLQEGEVRRVGESLARQVDVRVVAATHRDLTAMVEKETFRKDLYYRLAPAPIHLPPLRDRHGDVDLLTEHFLIHCRGAGITPAAAKVLANYSWPGNIRELKNMVEVASLLAAPGVIEVDHLELPSAAEDSAARHQPYPGGPMPPMTGDYHSLVEEYRRALVSGALENNHGNRSAAGRDLGLTRQALSYLVRKLDLM